MKRLSSNLFFLVLFILLCFQTDAAVFEISTEEVLVPPSTVVKVRVSASDLPTTTTSLQGSITWDRNLVTLLEANQIALPDMTFNIGSPERIGFSWFKASGEQLIGTQNIINLTFQIEPAAKGDTVFFHFDESPTTLEVANGFFQQEDLETIDGFVEVSTGLPVELAAFTASPRDNSIYLDWATASEINFDGFEVERSVDGNNFTAISWLDARGSETEGSTYGYSDQAVTTGKTYYYRLKMKDLDGSIKYSNVVTTKIDGQRPVVEVYPNPSFDETTIAFENFLLVPVPSIITVYDNMGRNVQRRYHESTIGINKITINIGDLRAGIYTITLEQGEYHATQKLIVQ